MQSHRFRCEAPTRNVEKPPNPNRIAIFIRFVLAVDRLKHIYSDTDMQMKHKFALLQFKYTFFVPPSRFGFCVCTQQPVNRELIPATVTVYSNTHSIPGIVFSTFNVQRLLVNRNQIVVVVAITQFPTPHSPFPIPHQKQFIWIYKRRVFFVFI